MRGRLDFVICGAGPTGLGAAWRLEQLAGEGHDVSWTLIDRQSDPGGAARSQQRDGFTWDLGGHVLFPHYRYFDELLDELIDEWQRVVPVRGAWMWGRFVPYPVQRNLRHFPDEVRRAALDGLRDRPALRPGADFAELLLAQFGAGLFDSFLGPLNRKMWATEPGRMSASWASQRSGSGEANVPLVDLDELIDDIATGTDRPGWTPDTLVRYPSHGGNGAIWERLAERLPSDRLRMGTEVEAVRTVDHEIVLADGERRGYDHLITSIPLDEFLRCLDDQPTLRRRNNELRPAHTTVCGVGLRGHSPPQLADVCSLYVPDPDISFWRLTFPATFSPHSVPTDAPHWSILCETNSAATATRGRWPTPAEAALDGLERLGFVDRCDVVATWERRIGHGYPVPMLGRDQLLNDIHGVLEPLGIWSRGRFGGWRYEVSNQDHAFMQGVEVVDRIVLGHPETTYVSAPSVNDRYMTS